MHKIFGEVLSKFPIFGQKHKNDGYSAILPFDGSQAARVRAYLVKISFLKVLEI